MACKPSRFFIIDDGVAFATVNGELQKVFTGEDCGHGIYQSIKPHKGERAAFEFGQQCGKAEALRAIRERFAKFIELED